MNATLVARARRRARSSSSSTGPSRCSKASATSTARLMRARARGYRPRGGRYRDAGAAAAGGDRRAPVGARRQVAALEGQIRAAADVLERRNLRAPQAGRVVAYLHGDAGAVIGSGVPVMDIVPDGDRLVVETRLPPDAIDTVHVGRPATVRLTAYKRAKAPVLDGEVTYVSADLLEDERDGAPYFDARVSLDPAGRRACPALR